MVLRFTDTDAEGDDIMTPTDITNQLVAESEARFDGALAEYQAARAHVAAVVADPNRHRDAYWMAADRLVNAERLVGVFVAFRANGPDNERIVADIIAARAASLT